MGETAPGAASPASASLLHRPDSSSEASDEGYRTKTDADADAERPDSSCTQASQASSAESGVSVDVAAVTAVSVYPPVYDRFPPTRLWNTRPTLRTRSQCVVV